MSRAERRREERKLGKKPTFNLTEEQIDLIIREKVTGILDGVKEDATNEAINSAMILFLSLPMKVLIDHFWPKSYKTKIKEFMNYVLLYYEDWQNDKLDIEALREELWNVAGIRLIEEE